MNILKKKKMIQNKKKKTSRIAERCEEEFDRVYRSLDGILFLEEFIKREWGQKLTSNALHFFLWGFYDRFMDFALFN